MGNLQSLQCIAPTTYDEELDLHLAQVGLEVKDYLACQSTATIHDPPAEASLNNVLPAHLRDRPHCILLDYGLVLAALVEQIEVLVHREKLTEAWHDCSSTTSSIRDLEEEDEQSEAEASELQLGQERARTDITTFSGITTKAGHSNVTKKLCVKKKFTRRKESLNLAEVDRLEEIENMRKRIQTLVADTSREPFSCGIIEPCTSPRVEEVSSSKAVKENANVLHLRIKIKSPRYFYRQLLKWKPLDPLTLTIANGIEPTDLAPLKAFGHSETLPELEDISDESCSSVSEIDFGVETPSSPVRLLVSDSVFLDLALTGSLGLANKKRRPKAVLVDKKQLKSPDQYIVLLNRRSGIPLALISLKTGSEGQPPVVRIFSSKRRRPGQRQCATTGKLGIAVSDSLPLYSWAEIVTEGIYPDQVRYSIYMVTGSDESFETNPSYRAVHESPGSPSIRVVGRTEREAYHSDCATLSFCKDEHSGSDTFFKLSVSRGIDPALFICFAAFVDEALEKTMRIRCRTRT